MILAALACPVFNSCADFGTDIEGLKGDLEDLENRVVALEQRLNTDLAALQALLQGQIDAINGEIDGINGDIADLLGKVNGLVTIKECKQNANGEYELTLSDGTKFTVYPKFEQDYKGIVTTVTLDGEVYWAIFDETGAPKPITDAEGNLIPVVEAVPQTMKGDDGFFYVSFDGGQTWEPTGVTEPCVFSGVEVVYTDYYTDEQEAADPEWNVETPMYVVLTLADGNTITVSLDGAATFLFASNYGGLISSQYIPEGSTTAISVQATNISDWVKEVPAGWKVVEDTKYLKEYGQAEFHVTAPTAEAIATGMAVAEGNLKVLAVAEGGKSITATVKLTTLPFTSFTAGKGNINVEMNSGLGGYLVGISKAAEYDPEAILAELKPIVEYVPADPYDWSDMAWSPWYVEENTTPLDDNYFDSSVQDYPIADLKLTEELVEGEQYVVWAVGLNYWYIDWLNSGYSVGSIVSAQYLNASIELDPEQTVVTFNDIQINVQFKGVENFFGFFADGSYSTPTLQKIADDVNNQYLAYDEYLTVSWENGNFTGSPIELVNSYYTIEPDTKYYLWLVPRVEGKTEYSASDIYYYEWTTEGYLPGGKAVVTAGEPVLDFKKITVDLSAENAAYIYYSFLDPEMLSTIADKQAYLLESGYRKVGASATVSQANIAPGTTKTLIALAIDEYGCYGEVFQQDYTTKTMEYAAATVTAELQGTPSVTGLVKLSCDAEVDTYYYWYGETSAWQWTNASYFGGSAEAASAFIALTPNSYLLTAVAPANIPADGIEMSDLVIASPTVFVVSAKLTDGTFTQATVVEFTPALNLGNFVYATDDNGNENAAWAAAKPTVTYNIEQVGDFTTVSWSVEVPAGFTAKTSCFSEEYLTNSPTAKDKVSFILSYPYIDTFDVVAGETYYNHYASKGYHIYTVICDAEGNYYETFVETLDIKGGFGV